MGETAVLTQYLILESTAADAVRSAGIFRNSASLSTTIGSTVTLKIPGAEMDVGTFGSHNIAIGAKGATCGTGAFLDIGLFDVLPTTTDWSTTELAYTLDVAADVPPGKYPICYCPGDTSQPDVNVTFTMTDVNRTGGPYEIPVSG